MNNRVAVSALALAGLVGALPASADEPPAEPAARAASEAPMTDAEVLARWDDNGNGHITCAEARRHRIAPVPRDHPAYRFMRDADGDGVVCERSTRERQ